jgi:hypothetical protein
MDEIEQVRTPGRHHPYVTIVDTGLACAVSQFLAGVVLAEIEGDWDREALIERAQQLGEALTREIERRTF